MGLLSVYGSCNIFYIVYSSCGFNIIFIMQFKLYKFLQWQDGNKVFFCVFLKNEFGRGQIQEKFVKNFIKMGIIKFYIE